VVGEYHSPTTGNQAFDGDIEGVGQLGQFTVDLDAQGLERALGRMAATASGRCRDRFTDKVRQLECVGDGAGCDQHRCDPAGVPLVTVGPEHRCEVGFCVAVDDVGCGHGLTAVHPHVERTGLPVAEPPIRTVDLGRGDTEVEQEAGKGLAVEAIVEEANEVTEGCVYELDPVTEGGQAAAGRFEGGGVAVDAEQSAVGSGLQEGDGMATASQCGVEQGPGRGRCEGRDDLVEHDRKVREPVVRGFAGVLFGSGHVHDLGVAGVAMPPPSLDSPPISGRTPGFLS
ncbi:uncharacterized protein METZ01_LOCUS311860, partial [marine metagenome]